MKHYVDNTLTAFVLLLLLAGCSTNNQQTSDTSDAEKQDSVAFKKHTLTHDFISEGVAVGDVNQDGHVDVMSGAYWFEAPAWQAHEIFEGKTFDPAKEYSNSFLNFSTDVNQDGWIDFILIDYPGKVAWWYENPKNVEGHWPKHILHETVEVGNESPALVDMDGDKRLDLLCADSKEKQIVWLRAPADKSTTTWTRFAISEKNVPGTDRFSHGIGLGDINMDGRKDVIIKEGWWEAPEDRTKPNWVFHAADLGEDCSHMHALDVNGDGLNDVVSASAHKYGVWWYEQGKDADGNMSWEKHEVSKAFSQSHSSALTDLSGDGNVDLIIGKRFFAHNDTDNDPGGRDPAVLYWFEHTPGAEPFFKAHQIDNDSGSGLNIVTQDITKDNATDIVIGNKKGVFVFERIK
jgi:hypothetical protein